MIWILLIAAMLAACSPYPRESERMAEAMAQAEAVYGDGSLLIETDTALFVPGLAEASQYYAGKRQYGKAALAALYNGYTERDFDKEAAMVSFKEAERYGELAHDSLTMARAEYWMGKLLYDEYNHQEALVLLRQSDGCFSNLYAERALATNLMACCYIQISEFDTALLCLNRSLEYADVSHSGMTRVKALNNLAVLYQLVKNYDKSIETLRIVNVENQGQRATNLLNLANAFFYSGEEDSAGFYYQKVEMLVSDSGNKKETLCSAYAKLAKWYEYRADLSSALDYRKKYESCLDAIRDEREQKRLFCIQKQYDYETLQNAMNKKIIWRHRIITVSCVLLLFMTFAVLLLQHRHRQTLMEEERLKSQLHDLKTSLQQKVEPQVVDMMVVSQLRTIITANRLMDKVNNPGGEWLALLSKVMSGKSEAFEAAKEVVESVYPKLYAVILGKYPNLSVTESRVCLLSCFDLTNAEMAELLGLSTNTVNQTRSSLRKKLELGMEKMTDQLRGTLLDGENHQ